MNFTDLHERLRLELIRRIDRDTLTGSRLAQQTGFRQAHISNFLNRKRALSLDGLDRVLAAQNLTINQILETHHLPNPESADRLDGDDPAHSIDLNASATRDEAPESHIEIVPLVPSSVALEAELIPPHAILEHIPISAALLYENRPRCSSAQGYWRRFVAIRADAPQAAAMDPLLTPGAVIILDRHYTSLALYRSTQRNLYAVRCGSTLLLRFADFDDDRLILRPNSSNVPVQLLPVNPGQTPSDLIVGRVCLVFNQL